MNRITTRTVISRLLLLLFLAAMFPAHAAVNFIQLTDPHIFDKREGEDIKNRIALTNCINQIRRMTNGPACDFIAVTGDLGVELLDTNDAPDWNDALNLVAGYIRDSRITNWLFVPGNNDLGIRTNIVNNGKPEMKILGEEKPEAIWKYHRFITDLKASPLLSGFQVIDLCPSDTANPSQSITTNFSAGAGRYQFLGFNNASFKGNNQWTNMAGFHAAQLDAIAQVEKRINALGPGDFIYLFYHIPEIDDPGSLSFTNGDPRLAKLEAGKGLGIAIKDHQDVYRAWTVSNDVTEAWNKLTANPKIRGLFTGHFHSSESTAYRNFDWLTNTYPQETLGKLHVCPPIACKFQDDKTWQARGFRACSINDNGEVTTDIVWFGFTKDEPGSGPPGFKGVMHKLLISVAICLAATLVIWRCKCSDDFKIGIALMLVIAHVIAFIILWLIFHA